MSYLKSDFITLYGPASLKPKIPSSFYRGNVYPSEGASINNRKPCLYNLKDFYQESKQQGPSKTPPLILFVNLLMKDGKKTHALRVLSMTLSLFKARLSKIKLDKYTDSLKEPSKSVYQYFFYPFKDPWQNTFSKHLFSNYSIKAQNCSVVFSSKSHMRRRISKTNTERVLGLTPSLGLPERDRGLPELKRGKDLPDQRKGQRSGEHSLVPWVLRYRKVFPFISNFCFLFDDFYARKRFFSGKFLKLKPFKDKKNKEHFSLSKKYKKKSIILKKKEPVLFLNKSSASGNASYIYDTSPLDNIAFIVNPFRKEQFLDLESYSRIKTQRKKKSTLVYFKECLWYKTLAQKPSWDSLTSAQKNSFLFCLYKAISNVKPPLECRTKRIGGSNKQIPSQVSEHRQWGIAIRWIIEVAQNEFSKRKNKSLEHKELFIPNLNFNLENSGNIQERSQFSPFTLGGSLPRFSSGNPSEGDPSVSDGYIEARSKTSVRGKAKQSSFGASTTKENKSFISSLLQRRPKSGPLKNHSPKTKFYYFCFFLAESLENAYYKRGQAMQKRNLWVETALANRAFLRYRWW